MPAHIAPTGLQDLPPLLCALDAALARLRVCHCGWPAAVARLVWRALQQRAIYLQRSCCCERRYCWHFRPAAEPAQDDLMGGDQSTNRLCALATASSKCLLPAFWPVAGRGRTCRRAWQQRTDVQPRYCPRSCCWHFGTDAEPALGDQMLENQNTSRLCALATSSPKGVLRAGGLADIYGRTCPRPWQQRKAVQRCSQLLCSRRSCWGSACLGSGCSVDSHEGSRIERSSAHAGQARPAYALERST